LILLDTNVVSEPMRLRANPRVQAWLDDQAAETLFLSTTSLSELLMGLELLPKSRRREHLSEGLSALVDQLFGERILSFDRPAAEAFARIIARARRKGHAISVADGQIAAIATVHGFSVATRDAAPFLAAGVTVIDPWQANDPASRPPRPG
jgi:toxin FitB